MFGAMKFRYGDRVRVVKGALRTGTFLVSGLTRDGSRLLLDIPRRFTTKRMRRRGLKDYSLRSVNPANVRHVDNGGNLSKVGNRMFGNFKVRFHRSDGSLLRSDILRIINTKRRLVSRPIKSVENGEG